MIPYVDKYQAIILQTVTDTHVPAWITFRVALLLWCSTYIHTHIHNHSNPIYSIIILSNYMTCESYW